MHLETSTARASDTNFPFRTSGKIVVVLSDIPLPHPEKGDIVNIGPSTKILNDNLVLSTGLIM